MILKGTKAILTLIPCIQILWPEGLPACCQQTGTELHMDYFLFLFLFFYSNSRILHHGMLSLISASRMVCSISVESFPTSGVEVSRLDRQLGRASGQAQNRDDSM